MLGAGLDSETEIGVVPERSGMDRRKDARGIKPLLADIVEEIQRFRQTGQLAVSITGVGNHYKIFFRDGDIYHLVCGKLSGAECLAALDVTDFAECFFLPNVRVEKPQGKVPPADLIIRRFREHGIRVERRNPMTAASQRPARAENAEAPVSAPLSSPETLFGEGGSVRGRLEAALAKTIHDVGNKIVATAVEELNSRTTPPTSEEFFWLVERLKEELQGSEAWEGFLDEIEKVLSDPNQPSTLDRIKNWKVPDMKLSDMRKLIRPGGRVPR